MSAAGFPARERILTAAIDVMRCKGVAGATTRAIAAEAGVSEALIYRYFKSKLDVLRTAVREYVASIFKETLQALAEQVEMKTPAANLERIAVAALAFYRDLIPVLGALFSESALIDWYRDSLVEDNWPYHYTCMLRDYIALEQRHGRLAAALDPMTAARMLLGACFQHVFFAMIFGPDQMGLDGADLARLVSRNIAPD